MKTLVVNLGPLGDVARTTVILNEIEDEIYWLGSKKCIDVLKSDKIKRVYFIDEIKDVNEIKKENFDLVISLNEQIAALEIVRNLKYKKIIGVFLDKNYKIDYTPESSYWFDMSLSGKYGKEHADKLKLENRKSYPQIMIEMVGKKWAEQKYNIGFSDEGIEEEYDVGIITEVKGLWPNKAWSGYDELKEILEKEGYKVNILGMREKVLEHMVDIAKCRVIVCGDTFGMHIALALGKKVVGIFNCTSPYEIYDYGIMEKVVSPMYEEAFYKKEFNQKVISSIKIDEVYKPVKKLLNDHK